MLSSLSELMEEAAEGGHKTEGLVDGGEESRIQEESSSRSSPAKLRGVLTTQDALKAAEHGNSDILAAYLHAGGDPMAVSRLHHLGWSLLHLATGCALMGGTLSYRTRPEPDCPGGFSNCVALLLAAGGDPNVQSKNGHTPLIGACLSGDADCCRLLLQAGAFAVLPSEARSVFEAARRLNDSRKSAVLAVLDSPPKRLPRSPLDVRVRLTATEDSPGSVEMRWRTPPEVGEVQRYVVRGFTNGEEIQVRRDARAPETSSLRAPNAPPGLMMSFRNRRTRIFGEEGSSPPAPACSMSRGIALRQLLGLPVPLTTSTLIHGLMGGLTYHFTVSCVVLTPEGELLESPPSLSSRPIHIPHADDDDDWNTAEIIDKVLSYSAAGSATPPTAHPKNLVVVVGDGEVLPEDFEFEEEDGEDDDYSEEETFEEAVALRPTAAREANNNNNNGAAARTISPNSLRSFAAESASSNSLQQLQQQQQYLAPSSSASEETPSRAQHSHSYSRRLSVELDDDDDDEMERRAADVIIKKVFEPLRMDSFNSGAVADFERWDDEALSHSLRRETSSGNCLLM